jgi:hypothetical protein
MVSGVMLTSSATELTNMQRYHITREITLPQLNENEGINI